MASRVAALEAENARLRQAVATAAGGAAGPADGPDAEQLRLILEGATDYVIFTTDRDRIVTSWSPGAQAVLGLTADEMVGRTADLIWTPEDRAAGRPAQEIETARRDGRAPDVRWHAGKDGRRVFLNGSVRPLHDGAGTEIGFLKIARDVTAEKERDDALHVSEEFNRRILQASADCIKVLDLDARLEFMSDGGMGVMEVDDFTAVRGAYWPDFWQDEDREAALAAVEQARGGGTGRFQGFATTLKGSPRWWDVALSPINGPDGRPEKLLCVSRDVTATRQAQIDAGTHEARYRALFENIDVGFCILEFRFDADGRAVDYRHAEINPAFERQSGLYGKEGQWVSDVVPGLERHWFDTYGGVAITGEAVRFENHAEPLDRWFDVYAFRTGPAEDRRVGVLFTDVTAAKAARAALQESEARFRNMADHAPVMMWVTDADGRCTYLNRCWYEFTGQTEEEGRDFGWLDAVHPDDRGWSGDVFLAANAKAEPFRLEYRLRAHDGGYRWAIDAGSPRRAPDGAFLGYVGSVTDIHERKLAEEELEARVAERTAERDRLWNLSPDMLARADFAGMMSAVSPAWTPVLGWSENELLTRGYARFMHPDDEPATSAAIGRMAETGTPTRFENRIATKAGGWKPIEWTVAPEPDGRNFIAVGRDISETKQREAELEIAQEQLRQAQKMEAVGQLTGGIAHDFNNLLTGVIGSLDLMQRRVAKGEFDRIERYATAAMTSANRAAALTHRLLAFSRRQPLDPKATNANRLVTGMEELLRRTIGESVRLEIVTAGGLWQTLCDPHQLESAILNLAINARDAMTEAGAGGTLTIETCNAHLDNAYAARSRDVKPGQYVCICVSDTGTGMSAEVIAKAFDPFFTTKPLGQGTGLGLSMIYGFARQSEGYAKIYSEVGKGTTIKLYLPRYYGESDEAEEAEGGLTDAHRSDAGEVVLVVEDETAVRDLVVDVLEELGYRAVEAADGPAGLKLLQSDMRVDLLVTDVGLPGLNGRQLADAAREGRPALKVLFMTGYAENATVANGFLDPGMAMITKPFAIEALATRIRDMIEEG